MCRAQLGAEVTILISPVLKIRILELDQPLDGYEGLIFTSENGVRAFDQNWGGCDLPAYCVGTATAEAARRLGMRAVSADGAAEQLLELIKRHPPKGKLLHVHGQHTRGKVVARLQDSGVPADGVVAYQQIAAPLTAEAQAALAGEKPLLLPLFSPRSARIMIEQAGQITAPLCVIAISPAVREVATGLGAAHNLTAPRPDAAAMLAVIKRWLEKPAL